MFYFFVLLGLIISIGSKLFYGYFKEKHIWGHTFKQSLCNHDFIPTFLMDNTFKVNCLKCNLIVVFTHYSDGIQVTSWKEFKSFFLNYIKENPDFVKDIETDPKKYPDLIKLLKQ